jgi:prevent-host-death family protein
MVENSSAAWQVQEARAGLSRLIDAALAGRPQRITRHGRETVVVISADHYDSLAKPHQSLTEFLHGSPLAEVLAAGELELERPRDTVREIDL